MTPLGWTFMLLYWTGLGGLLFFCLKKILGDSEAESGQNERY